VANVLLGVFCAVFVSRSPLHALPGVALAACAIAVAWGGKRAAERARAPGMQVRHGALLGLVGAALALVPGSVVLRFVLKTTPHEIRALAGPFILGAVGIPWLLLIVTLVAALAVLASDRGRQAGVAEQAPA